jgi:hypothetical protein
MQREVKIGLAMVVAGLAVFAAVRFGSGPAAKTGLDLALANLPPGWAATHGAVSYNALSGDARVDNLVITQNDMIVFSAASVLASGITGVTPTAPPKRIGHLIVKDASGLYVKHIGRIEIDGLEVENIRKLFDPAFYPGGKPASDAMLPVVAGFDGADIGVHIDLAGMPVRPGLPPMKAVDVHVGQWHGGTVAARQFPGPPVAGSLQDWAFLATAARDVAYGPVTAKDVSEIIPNVGRLRIGAESVGNVKDGRIARLEATDITFDMDVTGKPLHGRMGLENAAVQDIDLNKMLDQLPAFMANPQANGGKFNAGLHVGGYDVSGATIDFAKAPLLTLASFNSKIGVAADGVQSSSGTMRGLKIVTTGRDVAERTAIALQRFGMADFNIDADFAGTDNPLSGHTKATKADFTLHGLGALRMTWDIGNVQNAGAATPMEQLAALRSIKLYSASIQWDDASFTDRIFHMLSAQTGKTETQLRSQLSVPVATLGFMMSEQPDAAAQVNAFLEGRHRLVVTLAPPHPPVSMADVAAAGATEKAPLLGVMIKGD